jgi:protein tyrosine kinase modulator
MNTPLPIHTIVEDFLDQLRGAMRFKWVALIVSWSLAVILWIMVFLVPNTYESHASVFVDTRTTLSAATEGLSVGDNIDSQIVQVREALLGGPSLRRVANDTNLMAGALTGAQQQAVIGRLRQNIEITGSLQPGGSMALFTITYKDRDRERSLRVVDLLLNTFVEGALGGKQRGSEEAEKFLSDQIADYGRRLSASEQHLAEFKKRNVGLLPGEQGDYFNRLQTEAAGLTTAQERLGLALRRRAELQSELQSGQRFTADSAGGPANPAAVDTEGEIARTQEKLSQLLLQYTDKYPSVIALRQTLKALEAREKAELAAAKHGDLDAATQLRLTANPVYQKLQEQYNAEQVDIAAMQQDIADREREIATLKAMVNTAPDVQAKYARLTRDYDVTRTQYNALLGRLDSTRLGQQAASTGIVKFQVIDPPTAAFKPVAPNRPLLILGSLVLSLAAGLGAAYVLHLLQPVFVSARQLGAITGLPVLGAVGMAWEAQHRTEQWRGRLFYAWAFSGLVVLAIGVLVLQTHISKLIGELLA